MTPKCTDCKRDQDECNCESIETITRQRDELLAALKSAVETIEWMHGCTAPADDEVEKAIREGNAAIASVKEKK